MTIIKELSSHMADLIAAGEVVERPASVAKELIENSIDAGSTNITVEMENGGITYLRIADNGIGMSAEDAPISFRRHATSKIRTEDDLTTIGTLGFRGEALAAISSVSKVDLFTKQTGELEGTHIYLEAGDVKTFETAGCPDGTTFIIKDLFYNTPARMKFLKKDFTEAGYITSVVQRAAMSNPHISFKCIKDGKTIFATSGNGDLFGAIYSVFGKEMSKELIEVQNFELHNMKVWGYISKPHSAKANRSSQHFFVNGRYIKSRTIQAALEESYRNSIISGKYPYCALNIEVPYGLIDVNVHPAKTEVKFAFEKQVFDTVYVACKNTLQANDNIPHIVSKPQILKPIFAETKPIEKPYEATVSQMDNKESTEAEAILPSISVKPDSIQSEHITIAPTVKKTVPLWTKSSLGDSLPNTLKQKITIDCDDFDDFETGTVDVFQKTEEKQANYSLKTEEIQQEEIKVMEQQHQLQEQQAQIITSVIPKAKVVGECFNTYILAQDKDGLILIDKHAAHERMIFNELKETVEIPTQVLLSSVVAEFSNEEFAHLKEHINHVRNIGFDIEEFGENSFIIREVPSYIDASDVTITLSEIAGKLMDNRSVSIERFDDLIHIVSCKAAIKGGSITSPEEMQSLCDRVLSDNNIASCPHGRPVTVRLTKYEIDKMFKRVNQ